MQQRRPDVDPVISVERGDPTFDWAAVHGCSDGGYPGIPVGQQRDCRILTTRQDGLHIHWFPDRIEMHVDRVDPMRDPIGHALADTKAGEGASSPAASSASCWPRWPATRASSPSAPRSAASPAPSRRRGRRWSSPCAGCSRRSPVCTGAAVARAGVRTWRPVWRDLLGGVSASAALSSRKSAPRCPPPGGRLRLDSPPSLPSRLHTARTRLVTQWAFQRARMITVSTEFPRRAQRGGGEARRFLHRRGLGRSGRSRLLGPSVTGGRRHRGWRRGRAMRSSSTTCGALLMEVKRCSPP
jgi:hypothetical protein